MLKIVFIFTVGLLPALLSQLFWRRVEQRSRDRLHRAINRTIPYSLAPSVILDPLDHLVDHLEQPITAKKWLGDANCQFSARSPYLRCAVNPDGPCQGCPQFQPNPYPSSILYISR